LQHERAVFEGFGVAEGWVKVGGERLEEVDAAMAPVSVATSTMASGCSSLAATSPSASAVDAFHSDTARTATACAAGS